jgi:hypothetical protein
VGDGAGLSKVFSQVSKGGVMIQQDFLDLFRLKPGKKVRLKDHDTGWAQTKELKELGKDVVKDRAREILDKNLEDLAEAQKLLYADDRYALLIVLQAMAPAGKDGTIKHVMSGVNPQGCQVFSFKKPSAEELNHNFLWRYMKSLPERGRIGIFNRSYARCAHECPDSGSLCRSGSTFIELPGLFRTRSLPRLESTPCVFADEVERFAAPFKRGPRCKPRESDACNRVLDHVVLRKEVSLAQRQVRLDEIHDPVVNPLRCRCFINGVQREFQLGVRPVMNNRGRDLQEVTQDQPLEGSVGQCCEP